jgi:hypothetical protein
VAYAAPDDPEDTLGAHPLQDHWGQFAEGWGTGLHTSAWGGGDGLKGVSVAGRGVVGYVTRPHGVSYAMYARNASTDGYALFALALGSTGLNHGVYSRTNSGSGRAVSAYNAASTGTAYGVRSEIESGSGYAGYFFADGASGTNYGIYSVADGSTGRGGYFLANNDSGGFNYGVYARSDGTSGRGVFGYGYNTSAGTVGVYGRTRSASGFGVVGFLPGYDTSDRGSYYYPGGMFAGNNGVIGVSDFSNGVGVVGVSNHTAGWGGAFNSSGNGVQIISASGSTGLSVSGGTKSAAVASADGERLLYTEESTEVWFTDYGFGTLADGAATINIDPFFASTVNLGEPYHVFLQAYGQAEIFVTNRSATGFEVKVLSGDPNVEFSYRIVAKRSGFESNRLELAPWSSADQLVETSAPGIGSGIPESVDTLEDDLDPGEGHE